MLSSVAWIFYDYCLLSVPMMHLSHFFSVFFYMCAEIRSHSSACHSDCWCGCMSFKKLVQNYTENLSPRLYMNIFSYIIQFGWLDTMFAILFFLNVIIWVKILQFLSNKCLCFMKKHNFVNKHCMCTWIWTNRVLLCLWYDFWSTLNDCDFHKEELFCMLKVGKNCQLLTS